MDTRSDHLNVAGAWAAGARCMYEVRTPDGTHRGTVYSLHATLAGALEKARAVVESGRRESATVCRCGDPVFGPHLIRR